MFIRLEQSSYSEAARQGQERMAKEKEKIEEGCTAITREQEKVRRLAAEVEREVEEMVLGIRPVSGVEGL